MPLIIQTDYKNPEKLIADHPILVSCICYVTARYVLGYEKIRDSLHSVVLDFLQSVFSIKLASQEDELAILQALLILYVFARVNAAVARTEANFSNQISYWSIKSTCEAFAMHANLHRAAGYLNLQNNAGIPLMRHDLWTLKYLYWLYLFTQSHL